jgi:hypothetical protein
MSRYVWIAAAALVVITAALLFWIDRSDQPAETRSDVARPMAHMRLDGGEWSPHPDRAGLPRRRHTE